MIDFFPVFANIYVGSSYKNIMIKMKTKLNITPKEASRLFRAVNYVSDTLENILESRGKYNAEFISGLKLSVGQARSGYLKKISSLKEL